MLGPHPSQLHRLLFLLYKCPHKSAHRPLKTTVECLITHLETPKRDTSQRRLRFSGDDANPAGPHPLAAALDRRPGVLRLTLHPRSTRDLATALQALTPAARPKLTSLVIDLVRGGGGGRYVTPCPLVRQRCGPSSALRPSVSHDMTWLMTPTYTALTTSHGSILAPSHSVILERLQPFLNQSHAPGRLTPDSALPPPLQLHAPRD